MREIKRDNMKAKILVSTMIFSYLLSISSILFAAAPLHAHKKKPNYLHFNPDNSDQKLSTNFELQYPQEKTLQEKLDEKESEKSRPLFTMPNGILFNFSYNLG
jgi:hypothetical protein